MRSLGESQVLSESFLMMGISLQEYAFVRGISRQAVHKAIKQGRITPEADGTIEPEKANRQWESNTLDAPQGERQTTYIQAKTANEVLKAQTNKVRLKQLQGELIERREVEARVFRLARTERDAWLSWPARISSQMASELKVDTHTLHTILERYVREHLTELAEIVFDP